MLGPEANHYILVENAANFRWREGGFVDLIPLLGDGMLTIDGGYHKRARRIMLPAFHRDRLAATTETMVRETERALDGWAPGSEVDVYHWTRALALRIAMRALFGFDPARGNRDFDIAEEFERALSYYGRDYFLQSLRGPGTPWKRMHRARVLLDRADLRGDRPTARRGRLRRGHPLAPHAGARRGGRLLQRPRAARPAHDAAVRRSRHDDLDRHLPLLRAGPASRGARARARGERARARRARAAGRRRHR